VVVVPVTQPSAGMIDRLPLSENWALLLVMSVAVRSVMPTFALKATSAVC
jgi:hypothetical protein